MKHFTIIYTVTVLILDCNDHSSNIASIFVLSGMDD